MATMNKSKTSLESIVREIKRKTRRKFTAEEKRLKQKNLWSLK